MINLLLEDVMINGDYFPEAEVDVDYTVIPGEKPTTLVYWREEISPTYTEPTIEDVKVYYEGKEVKVDQASLTKIYEEIEKLEE